MADASKSGSRGGCVSKIATLMLLAITGAFGSVLYFVSRPQDLSDLAGTMSPPARDLRTVLQNSVDRGYPLTLSEAELNGWLARTLVPKQGGYLEKYVTLGRVRIRLEEGTAEVIQEREIFGKPFTTSMFLQIEKLEDASGVRTEVIRHGGPYHAQTPTLFRGGRFGRLVVPQGFLLLVMPGFEKLAAVFPKEIELALEKMPRMKIEKDRLVLDPRAPEEKNPTF